MLKQIINARILTPQGWLKDGSVIIRDNKILEVTNCDLAVVGAELIDAKGMYVVPGGVEIHAHGGGGGDGDHPGRLCPAASLQRSAQAQGENQRGGDLPVYS